MSSINKSLIIYRGVHCERANRHKAIKYGLHLGSIQYANHSPPERKLFQEAALTDVGYYFGSDQSRLVQDIKKVSDGRRFKLNFYVGFDFDIYKSEASLDSQFSVYSNGEDESENELDLEIQSESRIIQKDQRMVKKLFKQAKRVAHFSLTFQGMNQNHERALRYLPMLSMLEDCQMKIKIRALNDISVLRDLLNQAKQRKYWPNMKSMVIRLRHSYNQENCSSRFIRFCQILQEVSEITQDLPWIRIQLKVKYMWRFNESAIVTFQEALKKAQNQLVRLSLVTGQPNKLKPLFKTIGGMKNLDKFSIRFNESSDLESVNSLEELTDSLKKTQSLRRLKIQGKNILDKEQNEKLSTQGFIKNLSDFSQITSFNFQERNQFIDETLRNCFSNSISKLPQLQILALKTITRHQASTMISPDLNSFLDFFVGLKSLQNLRIFIFDMRHPSYQGPRIDGSQVFQAACEALQNQKELRKLDFHYPWVSRTNSDIQELSKVLPNLQKLEYFSLLFAVQKFIEPVENDTFMNFAKAISFLKAIQSFSINLEMKEVNSLTYEAALIAFKHFQARNASRNLRMTTMQADGGAVVKANQLKGISAWKQEKINV